MDELQQDWRDIGTLSESYRQWAEDFWQGLPERPITPNDDPLYPSTHLAGPGIGAEGALERFSNEIAPLLSASLGSRYWGFITGGATPAALLGDWLTSAVDQNLSIPTDSVASAVEEQTLNWLLDLFDLPDNYNGVFTTGATASNLLGILCARQYAGLQSARNVAVDGMGDLDIEVFSAHPHASVIKCLGIAGLGRKFVQVGSLPDREAIDVGQLENTLQKSKTQNLIVVANCGTVTTNDFDDLIAVANVCRKYKAWLHVDAAFGLFARLLKDKRPLTDGLELADSITSDAHKWLNVPYDCGFFFTRNLQVLEDSLAVAAPYLAVTSQTPVFMDRGVENSRRFRALPVWFTLTAYGKSGHRAIVQSNCRLAAQLADWVDASPDYELLSPCVLNTVLFRAIFKGDTNSQNERNRQRLIQINATGQVFLTPGLWQEKAGFRAAISNWQTKATDIVLVCKVLAKLANR